MRDEWFIRGEVPMTKSEVRAVSVEKLELSPDSVLYDIGAGTGSVSVEAAAFMPEGTVYAVEKKREAVELLEKNRKKFQAEQIRIIEGAAPEALEGLEALPMHFWEAPPAEWQRFFLCCWQRIQRSGWW